MIKNIQWFENRDNKKINQIVIEKKESFIDKTEIVNKNQELAGIIDNDGKSNVVNVEVKMLRTDWITHNGSLYGLVDVFSEANSDLFKTDLFRTLMGGFWDRLKNALIISCFIPFIIFSLSNVIYLTYFMSNDVSEDFECGITSDLTDFNTNFELVTRWTLIVTQGYFVILQIL